ncbi:hypothetical protein ACFL96_13715 [Thermoproteota archaeon]
MKKISILSALFFLFISTGLFAYSPYYIEITSPNVYILEAPISNSTALYNAFRLSIFLVIDETDHYYNIQLLDGRNGWVPLHTAAPYTKAQNPPVELIGLVSPVPPSDVPGISKDNPITAEGSALPTANPDSLADAAEGAVVSTSPLVIEDGAVVSTSPLVIEDRIAASTFPSVIEYEAVVSTAPLVIPDAAPISTTPSVIFADPETLPLSHRIGSELLPPSEAHFVYPQRYTGNYPDISVDGFYEIKLSGRNYTPKDPTDPRWEIIQRDPVYTKLPRDVLVGDPKLDIRYQISVEGQLEKDLSVHLDVEQEPDFPGKYDVGVKYQNHELTFYHFDAVFRNGEFIDVRKALNGAKFTSFGDNWETIIATGRQRSEPKKFEGWGNGRQTVAVGNRSLLEGSVIVYVNNQRKHEGADYTINYYSGEVTFSSALGTIDYVEIIYEFTNPIEDFIPVLSRKNFLGAQYLWKAQAQDTIKKLTATTTEIIEGETAIAALQNKREFPFKKHPIVLGSDKFYVNGQLLQRNTHYFVRHKKGKIVFHDTFEIKPSDQFKLVYEYYVTEHINEDIIANNSPGPYQLLHQDLVQGTVRVYLNDEIKEESYDYSVDYSLGRIDFNYHVSYPSIISVEYSSIKTMACTADAKDLPLSIGVTYLNEFVKGDEDELIQMVVSENILTLTDEFTTTMNPLTATDDIHLYINGDLVTSSDFIVENFYTGQIRITTASYTPGDAVVVNYSYGKSYRTRSMRFITDTYSGQREEISFRADGKYTHLVDFYLDDIPVKYKGVDFIEVFQGTEFQRRLYPENGDFVVDYGDNGIDNLIIQFKKSSEGGQYPNYPQAGETLYIYYDYSPEVSPYPGNITQTMYGITAGTKLSEKWSVNSELVIAQHNFAKPQMEIFDENIPIILNQKTYNLDHNNLVEDSESVRGDNFQLTKDDDYYINYINGTITFITEVAPENTIIIDYKYYDNTGLTTGDDETQSNVAAKLETVYTEDNITVKGDVKFIDKEFLPIAPIKEKKGTLSYGGNLDWRLNNMENVNVDARRRDEYRGIKNGQDIYLHRDDIQAVANLYFWDNFFQTKHTARFSQQTEDPTTVSTYNAHAIDENLYDYKAEIAFGPDYFKTTAVKGFSKRSSDILDNYNLAEEYGDITSIVSTIRLDNIAVLGNVLLNPFYETSSTKRYQDEYVPSDDSKLEKYSVTSRIRRGIKSQYEPLTDLTAKVEYALEDVRTLAAGSVTENLNTMINSLYSVDYRPKSWFTLDFSHSHSEVESPLLNQKGKQNDNVTFRINRFSLYDAFDEFNIGNNWFISPFKGSYFTYKNQLTETFDHNDKYYYRRVWNSYSLKGFKPLKGVWFDNLVYDLQQSHSSDVTNPQITSENISNRNYKKAGAKMTVKPDIPILKDFSYTLDLEDRRDNSDSQELRDNATSNRTDYERPYFKRIQKLDYHPGSLVIGYDDAVLNLGRFKASFEEQWEDKVDASRRVETSSQDIVMEPVYQRDDQLLKKYTYSASYSPFNIFDLSGFISNADELFRSSYITGIAATQNTGQSIFRDIDVKSLKASYKPFSFLTLDGGYDRTDLLQYRSPSINISYSDVSQAYDDHDVDLLTDRIKRIESNKFAGATLTPFSFISIRGKGMLKARDEIFSTPNFDSVARYNQSIYSVGVVFHPFQDFNLSYDLGNTHTVETKGLTENKYDGSYNVIEFGYTPFQTETIKIKLSYRGTHTWGYDFNTLDEDNSQQGTGGAVQTEVIEREDWVHEGSLAIDIHIPIRTSPYVDKLVISGEGHLKKVDDQKKNTNSYEISGMIIKGTLLF